MLYNSYLYRYVSAAFSHSLFNSYLFGRWNPLIIQNNYAVNTYKKIDDADTHHIISVN